MNENRIHFAGFERHDHSVQGVIEFDFHRVPESLNIRLAEIVKSKIVSLCYVKRYISGILQQPVINQSGGYKFPDFLLIRIAI